MTPRHELRVLFGLLAQPFVAASMAFVLFPALDYTARATGLYSGRVSDDAAASVAFGAALAAVFVVVFGALPALGWVSRRGPITLRASVIAGALLGNLPAAVILVLAAMHGGGTRSSGASSALILLRAAAFGSWVGAVCGAVFWASAGAPRPAWRVKTLE